MHGDWWRELFLLSLDQGVPDDPLYTTNVARFCGF